MKTSQEIAETIKKRAKEVGITVKEMSEKCGISRNALSSMQSGGYLPRVENLCKMAEVLDCSVDYLLGMTDEPHSNSNHIIGNSNNGDNQINVGTAPKSGAIADGLTSEFMEAFQGLSFPDKMEVMNLTMQKMQKGA